MRDHPIPGYTPVDIPAGEAVSYDHRCIVADVAVCGTPFGLRIVLGATTSGGQTVGVLLDLEDVAAIAEAAEVITSGRLWDA